MEYTGNKRFAWKVSGKPKCDHLKQILLTGENNGRG